jgi:hypothetical protein
MKTKTYESDPLPISFWIIVAHTCPVSRRGHQDLIAFIKNPKSK